MRGTTWRGVRGGGEQARSPPYEIHFTAIKGQGQWILSMSELEQQGVRLFSSMVKGERPLLMTRRQTGFPLRRGHDKSLYLDGSVAAPGEFTVPPVPGDRMLSLLVDTGAMASVAGDGWNVLCRDVSTKGCDVRVVGGDVVRSAGTGKLTIAFKSG